MFEISFPAAVSAFTAVWALTRIAVWIRQRRIDWKRESVLLLMYLVLAVMIRFVLFPRDLADGHVQGLVFDASEVLSPRMNLIPFIHLFRYGNIRDLLWNVAGNVAMFIPVGIVLPVAYRKLDSLGKVTLAGAFLSLCIEIVQLPFPSRASDIDDLILNTLGAAAGYGIYAVFRYFRRTQPEQTERKR